LIGFTGCFSVVQGSKVGAVEELFESVSTDDPEDDEFELLDGGGSQLLVLLEGLRPLPNHCQEERQVGEGGQHHIDDEAVHEHAYTGRTCLQSCHQVDHVLYGSFSVSSRQQLQCNLVVKQGQLRLDQIALSHPFSGQEADKQKHTLLGSHLHEFLSSVGRQGGGLREEGEARVAVVTEELDEGGLAAVDLQDDGLEELGVVLDQFGGLLLEAEVLEEEGVEAGLGEDVDQAVGLGGVGQQEVEEFEDGLGAHALALLPEEPLDDLVLAEAPASPDEYMKAS
jgi:hypothetical protein